MLCVSRFDASEAAASQPSALRSYLQHVQEGSLSGIIESQKQELGVLVEQSEGGQDVPDFVRTSV